MSEVYPYVFKTGNIQLISILLIFFVLLSSFSGELLIHFDFEKVSERKVFDVSSRDSPVRFVMPSLLADSKNEKDPFRPKIWVFVGIPGTDDYKKKFLMNIKELKKAFDKQYNLPKSDLRILFGKGIETKYKACNATNLKEEFKLICDAGKKGTPVWVIFAGHANSIDGKGVNFNIPGKDLSAEDISRELKGAVQSPLGIFLGLPAANRFVKPLSGKNRFIIAAVNKEDNDNQPYYFSALVESFRNTDNDLNRDGYVSAVEIFNASKMSVEDYYVSEGMIQRENSTVDGNGDGRPMIYPAGNEVENGRKLKLLINESY